MSKEFKIGLITIIAGGLLYYGFNFLRGTDLFSPTNTYYVIYPNVSGLNVSNPVYFNGLPVGRVSGFQLQQNKGRIIVSLSVDENVRLSATDSAKLANDGLLGGKAIILELGNSEKPLQDGDTLKSIVGVGMLSEFEPVADNLNTTLTKVNELLDSLNNTDISGAVEVMKITIATLNDKISALELETTLDNTNALIVSATKRSEQLSSILESSDAVLDSLKSIEFQLLSRKVEANLDTLNNLMSTLKSNDGTLGKLISDDSVYNSLNKLLVDLDKLVIHFNTYPKDFMSPLGRKNKKLKGVEKTNK